MKKVGFTQAQVACIVACSQAAISQWQQGHSPSGKNVDKIKEIILYLKTLTRQSANKRIRCKSIRKKLGLTGPDVASFLSVTSSTIYRWEKGELPKDMNLDRIKEGIKLLKSIISSKPGSTKAA